MCIVMQHSLFRGTSLFSRRPAHDAEPGCGVWATRWATGRGVLADFDPKLVGMSVETILCPYGYRSSR